MYFRVGGCIGIIPSTNFLLLGLASVLRYVYFVASRFLPHEPMQPCGLMHETSVKDILISTTNRSLAVLYLFVLLLLISSSPLVCIIWCSHIPIDTWMFHVHCTHRAAPWNDVQDYCQGHAARWLTRHYSCLLECFTRLAPTLAHPNQYPSVSRSSRSWSCSVEWCARLLSRACCLVINWALVCCIDGCLLHDFVFDTCVSGG